MPLNQTLKGKTYPAFSYLIERERVTGFARAIGEDSLVFVDPEAARAAGYPEQVAPPTFLTTVGIRGDAQVVADPELGLDFTRVVHGEEAYEWARPVCVGETLTATPRIADIYTRFRNEFLVLESEVKDEAGDLICVMTTTLVSRGTAEG